MSQTLSEITEFIIDTKHSTPEYASEGYPCIRTPNIGRGYFILADVKYVNEETYRNWTERAVPETGDLILAREAPVGNVACIPPNLKPCIGQRTVLIRPKTDYVDPRYLTYLLLGDDCQNRMHAMAGGATVAHLNMSDIRNFELPDLPPLQLQRKLASVLSAYDGLIENNLRRIKILEEMAQNLYREWFVKFRFPGHKDVRFVDSPLGRIPEGWEVKQLGEILGLNYGKALKQANRREGNIPVYGSSGVVGYHDTPLVKGPGIIVGRKGNVGSVFWSQEDFYPIDTTYFVKSDVPLRFLFYNLQGKNFLNNDAAVPGLNRSQAYMIETVIPPSEILFMFCNLVEDFEKTATNLRIRNKNLRQTRDLLLPKLISGEIDVSELDIKIPQEVEA